MADDRETSIEEFRDAVNMPHKELADWLRIEGRRTKIWRRREYRS